LVLLLAGVEDSIEEKPCESDETCPNFEIPKHFDSKETFRSKNGISKIVRCFVIFSGYVFDDLSGGLGCSSPLPSLRQFGQVLLHIPLASPSFWSPESSRETFAAGKCIFIPQLYTDLWRDVRNHPKLGFS